MPKKVFMLLLIIIILSQQVFSQNPPLKPKLIVGIVVEGLRYDAIGKYSKKFTEKGFNRFVKEGAVYRNHSINYYFAHSGVGQASLSTGTTPSMHGIVSENWYERENQKMVYCADDPTVATIGSDSDEGKFSPVNLLSSTLGDELILSGSTNSKIFSVSMRNSASIFLAGHMSNSAYWLDSRTGKIISSSYYCQNLPPWVNDFNDKNMVQSYMTKTWTPLLNIDEYKESLPDDNPYENGFAGQFKTFPYNMLAIDKHMAEYQEFKYTPYANTFITDFALASIMYEKLGTDESTDLLFVDYATPAYSAELWGCTSIEYEDIVIRLDRDIMQLLTFLDETVGKSNYLVFLTSDHGSNFPQKYLSDMRMPQGTFNYKTAYSLLKIYLSAIFGKNEWIEKYNSQQFYFNHLTLENAKISHEKMETEAANLLHQFSGVSQVTTAHLLKSGAFADPILQKLKNSYYHKRSGDVFVNLNPGWVEESKQNLSYNSPYEYDCHIPLMWLGWKIKPMTSNNSVNITDIAPTISSILGIPRPNASNGNVIEDLFQE